MKRVLWGLVGLLLVGIGSVQAQQYWVREVTTNLPGDVPLGTVVQLTLTAEQGYGGIVGGFRGTLHSYLLTSAADQLPAHIAGEVVRGEWAREQYVVQLNPPACTAQVPAYCYATVTTAAVQVVAIPMQGDHILAALAPRGIPDKSLCEAQPSLYHDFGPECLNPVPYALSGFAPLGAAVPPYGSIVGYYWNVTEQRYWYVTQQGAMGWMLPPEQVHP